MSPHGILGPAGRDAALVAAWLVFAGSVVALLVAPIGPIGVVASTLGLGVSLAAGSIIVRRADVPRIGWLLVASGATLNYMVAAQRYALVVPDSRPAEVAVAALWSVPSLIMIAFVIFPTGRVPSRLGWFVLGLILLNAVAEQAVGLPAALGVVGDLTAPDVHAVTDPVTSVTTLGIFVVHARAYAGRTQVEQLQIKWFMLSLLGLAAIPLAVTMGPDGQTAVIGVIAGLPAVAIMLAMTRYRLYEIDRIISRTVGYALVLALLLGVGLGSLALVTTVLPTHDRFATATVTLLVVALSGPLRRRVLAAVDRRFDRTRYVARQVVEGFGRTVADETDLDAVRGRLHAVLGTTLAPATVAVWERGGTR